MSHEALQNPTNSVEILYRFREATYEPRTFAIHMQTNVYKNEENLTKTQHSYYKCLSLAQKK